MSGYVIKPADAALTHRAAFNPPLLEPGETVIGDAGWLIKRAKPGKTSLHITRQVIGSDYAEAAFAGGEDGEVALITAAVDTSAGRVLRKSFVLAVGRERVAGEGAVI